MEKGILSVIGNTPIIKLERVFSENRFQLYLKLEGMNSGGSAKDRSGYSMIMHAIEEGRINKDTVIIESSSGNLGIALAQICCYLGLDSYRPDQYNSEYNPLGHKNAMREIAEYFNNDVDYIFCATSTCGTIRGYVEYVREHNLKTKIIAVDAVHNDGLSSLPHSIFLRFLIESLIELLDYRHISVVI